MQRRDPRRRGLRLTLTLLFMIASLVLVPGSSSALSWCEEKLAPKPDTTGQGVDAVLNNQGVIDRIPPIGTEFGADKGLYEEYLLSGTTWFVIIETKDCFDENRTQAWPLLYHILWGAARAVDMVAIETLRFAIAPPLTELEAVVVDVVDHLRDEIWRPLLPAITILGAVTLAWWGLVRKRATLTFEGIVWMVAATTVGLWILGAPGSFMGMVNGIITGGENLLTSAVTTATDDGEDGRCIPGSPAIIKGVGEDHRDFIARQQSEYLYESLVCRPWLVGVIGAGPRAESFAEEHGRDLIWSQALTRTESLTVGLDTDEDGTDQYYENLVKDRQDKFKEISASVKEEDEYKHRWDLFSGAKGGERTVAALVGLVAALTGGLLIIAAAVGLLVVKFGFLLLMLLSPIFFLVGVHPGWGRRALLRWAELLVGLFLKIWMWMAMLLILVVVLNVILSSVQPYGLALMMLIALTVAVWKYKDALWAPLTTIQFTDGSASAGGGGGYSALRSQVARGATRAAGTATRAAGTATRKAGSLTADATKLATKGAVVGAGATGVGALAAGYMAARALTKKKNGGPDGQGQDSQTITDAFANMRERAPDRHGDSADRDRLVRQGAGAPRPTRSDGTPSKTARPSGEAPERTPSASGRVPTRTETGHGVRGDRQPNQAPTVGGRTSSAGEPRAAGAPRTDEPSPAPYRRRPKGGKGSGS